MILLVVKFGEELDTILAEVTRSIFGGSFDAIQITTKVDGEFSRFKSDRVIGCSSEAEHLSRPRIMTESTSEISFILLRCS